MSTLCSVVSAASAQLSALLSNLAPREIYYIGGPEPLPAPLTPAEEQSLLARLDTDGAAVRTTLIEHNLRLVVFIARKFDNTGIMLEDLISIGTIGLIKAVNTFDPSKKIKLATYASRCIENEVLMFLRRHSRTRMEVSLDEPLKPTGTATSCCFLTFSALTRTWFRAASRKAPSGRCFSLPFRTFLRANSRLWTCASVCTVIPK